MLSLVTDTFEPSPANGGNHPQPLREAALAHQRSLGSERTSRWRCTTLWLRVQADAFLLDPLGYLQAIAWRVRGLRVRSRNRISGLAGKSAFAYPFWIARREPEIRVRAKAASWGNLSTILPVIDCTEGEEGLGITLASLPANVQPVVLKGPRVPGARGIETVGELQQHFEGPEVWICPISPGDRLADSALAIYSEAIAGAPDQALLYGDDDLLDSNGKRTHPHFKPDWNPELFKHHDFLTGASIIRSRREDLQDTATAGWVQTLTELALQRSPVPLHLPFVLHHRRLRPEPIIPRKPADLLVGDQPSVTVIIPTRNRAELLQKCISGLRQTNYPDFQITIVDNESDEPQTIAFLKELQDQGCTVIQIPGPFNYSFLNNAAAQGADGELLCFLNNDVEMIDNDWLALLVRQAVRPEIGAVGARLLYADGTVQHAGVFTGIGGGAAHAHRFQKPNEPGYFARAFLPQRVSAVTAASMVVSREKFLSVRGFDEENFPIAFNDVDLCLKLNMRGWQSFYEPRATLIHHESKSRGSDTSKANRFRFVGELAALKRKWRTDELTDPFHHPHLSRFCEQFVIAI